MAFTVTPPSSFTVICVSLVWYAPSCGVDNAPPVARSFAWMVVSEVAGTMWSANGLTCHFGASAWPSAPSIMNNANETTAVAATVVIVLLINARTPATIGHVPGLHNRAIADCGRSVICG